MQRSKNENLKNLICRIYLNFSLLGGMWIFEDTGHSTSIFTTYMYINMYVCTRYYRSKWTSNFSCDIHTYIHVHSYWDPTTWHTLSLSYRYRYTCGTCTCHVNPSWWSDQYIKKYYKMCHVMMVHLFNELKQSAMRKSRSRKKVLSLSRRNSTTPVTCALVPY